MHRAGGRRALRCAPATLQPGLPARIVDLSPAPRLGPGSSMCRSGTSDRDAELPLGFGLASGHPLAERLELITVEDGASLLEHLALLLFHVVLDVLLHDLGLGAPSLVVDRQTLQLRHDGVD